MKTVRVILNPKAGVRAGLPTNTQTVEQVRTTLQRLGLSYELTETQEPEDARRLAREAVEAGCELVVAAGGDGTVREVAGELLHSEAALGILPLGTVMNVANVLGIPRDLEAAATLLKHPRIERMDVGKVRDQYFLETAGVGMDAALFHYLGGLVENGHWRNLAPLARLLLRYRAQRVTLRLDGVQRRYRALTVIVANSPLAGPALPVAPRAEVADRRLDVVVYRHIPVWQIVLHLLGLRPRRRLLDSRARSFRAARVEIDVRQPLPVHADGLLVGSTPASFEILPLALRVVVGELAAHRDPQSRNQPAAVERPGPAL